MEAYSSAFQESPPKRHKNDYGLNPLGFTIATFPGICNMCDQRIVPGQRIMKDPDYITAWDHLECARLEWFSEVDDDLCTPPAQACFEGRKKFCAWCTDEILAALDEWRACWLGWLHAKCDAGSKSDFVNVLRTLQQRYASRRMPQHCHQWRTLDELCTLAGVLNPSDDLSDNLLDTHSQPERSPLDHSVDDSVDASVDESVDESVDGEAHGDARKRFRDAREQFKARVRKHSSACINLVGRFDSAEGAAANEQDQSDDPDMQPAPPRRRVRPARTLAEENPSDAASDAHSQHASDANTDNEALETKTYKQHRHHTSANDGQRVGRKSRRRPQKQGELRRLIHPDTEGAQLAADPLLLCTSSHRDRPRVPGKLLGDADTDREASEEDETDSLDGFIEKDESGSDVDGDYTPSEGTGGGSCEPNGSGAGDLNEEVQPQSHTPVVIIIDTSSSSAGSESVSTAESDSRVNPVSRVHHKHVVIESSDDETQPGSQALGPATPAQDAQKVAGSKRLYKRRAQNSCVDHQ
ncbi:hypothetical protein ABBQ38_013785 [Trebouxia sp. C0009 RCD-2024]